MAFRFNCEHGYHNTVADAKSCRAGNYMPLLDDYRLQARDRFRSQESGGAKAAIKTVDRPASGRKAKAIDFSTPKDPFSEPPEVPAGHYAVGPEGATKFYRVDKPTEGRWAGWTFVKVQASDELYPIRNRDERERILREIGQDPKAAMLRYGREIGSCGHCHRTLTNPESLARGIGPVCASKMGW